jgi:hypothetical protein
MLWSAALEAAAYAVAAAYFFGRPLDGITLQRDGRAWRAQIAPLTTNSQIEPMNLAGIVARRLYETDGDFGTIAESISMRALKARFGPLFVTVLELIADQESVVRAIASQLAVKRAMSSEELAAHLRPVMEDEMKEPGGLEPRRA